MDCNFYIDERCHHIWHYVHYVEDEMNTHDMIQTLSKCSVKTVAGMEMTEVTKLLHEQSQQIAQLQKENETLRE